MRIETARIILRPITLNDLESVHAYASSETICKYMLWGPNTLDETKKFIEYTMKCLNEKPITYYELGIDYQGKIIGGVALILNALEKKAELGWILHEDYQRKGIAFEAVSAMMKMGIALGYHVFYATADSRNIASIKLMEKLGMKFMTLDKSVRLNNVSGKHELDQVMYQCEN